MTISFPVSAPSVTGLQGITLRAQSVVAISESPFTLDTQAQRHPGQRWQLDVMLPPMRRANGEEWVAFLLSLNGREGTFLLGDPAGTTARGSLGGTPLVKGGSQTGQDLLIDGCSAGVTNWIRKGDYVQLGSGSTTRLHKSLTDADSNGSGEVTLTLWPRLRSSPADNAAVTVASCKGLWRRTDNAPGWSIDKAGIYTIAFGAVEAI